MATNRTRQDVSQRVAANARRLRNLHGWSARELADRMTAAGCPTVRATVTNWENGRRDAITVDELCTLAEVFGRPATDLLAERVECAQCGGNPPAGFICRLCGDEGHAA